MKIMKDKRAMFFTILVIALLSLFLISYTFYSVIQDREAVNKRIKTMNSFVFSIEQDIPRELYVSGFRVIFLLQKYITDNGVYLTDVDDSFHEVFFNGTINGVEQSLMEGANFSGIQESLNEKANLINADVTLLNPNLVITQDDPWNVKVILTTDFTVRDRGGLVSWNKTLTSTAYIPIRNFIDPVYYVEAGESNKFNRTIYNPLVSGNDVSNLSSHAERSLYNASTEAPSFLDRLEGNLSAQSPYGVESFVHLTDMNIKSVVDHVYFSSDNPPYFNIQGMPSWFRLDQDHIDAYGIDHLKT